MNHPIVLGISGASGVIYALRLLDALTKSGRDVHVTISTSGQTIIKQELGMNLSAKPTASDLAWQVKWLPDAKPLQPVASSIGQISVYDHTDFMAPIASGSHRTDGMVVCPCSGSTMSAVAHGTSANLIHRAADVHLKELRPLILVPRETPLSLVQIDNMRRAAESGAIVLPAMPGWYHGVKSLGDLVDFVVARVLDQLRVPHALMLRWGEKGNAG